MNIYLILFIIILFIVILFIIILINCNYNTHILENFTTPIPTLVPSNTDKVDLNLNLALNKTDINVNDGNVNILSTTSTTLSPGITVPLTNIFSSKLHNDPITGNLKVSGNLILSKNSKIQIGDIVIYTGTYLGSDKSNVDWLPLDWMKTYQGATFVRFTHINDYNNPNISRNDIPGPGQIDIIFIPTSTSNPKSTSAVLVRGDYLFSNPINDNKPDKGNTDVRKINIIDNANQTLNLYDKGVMNGVIDVTAIIDGKCPDGWDIIDEDLNEKCNGNTIKLCKKMGSSTKGIKSLRIFDQDGIIKDLNLCNNIVPVDLKMGTGKNSPTLYLCREYGYPFTTDVKITSNDKEDASKWQYALNNGTIQDLEIGCPAGSPTKYLIWSKVNT